MPIFAYKCDACGHEFDVLQKLGADAPDECPECRSAQLRKLLSAPNFHLKGKGWRKNRDAESKPPAKRPRFAHTLDSATPHAEHHDHQHSDANGRDSKHKHNHDD
ncbi:MAG: zinc ribbon domain-containing protein [Gammaproteobacteria bacterium]|nr:zinc ribbon domain-containing protein [Gammaproteobacteria bacterium]